MIKSKLEIKETKESLSITAKEPVVAVEELVKTELPPEPIPLAPETKEYAKPQLMIEEVARKFKQFKPHHLPSLISFCRSRGYPTIGTEVELISTLKAFGWHT